MEMFLLRFFVVWVLLGSDFSKVLLLGVFGQFRVQICCHIESDGTFPLPMQLQVIRNSIEM